MWNRCGVDVLGVTGMSWWLWILLGVALLIAEITVDAAFWLLFLGLSAIIVGLGSWFGLTESPVAQWFMFAGLSLTLLYFLRGRLRSRVMRGRDGPVRVVEGELATAVSAIAPGSVGKALLRGTEWDARNTGASTIAAGARIRVARVNQLVLELGEDGH